MQKVHTYALAISLLGIYAAIKKNEASFKRMMHTDVLLWEVIQGRYPGKKVNCRPFCFHGLKTEPMCQCLYRGAFV